LAGLVSGYPPLVLPGNSAEQDGRKHKIKCIDYNLSIGYDARMKKQDASEAARLMAHRSVSARIRKWGKEEFQHRMQEWGKLGGRPKGSGKKEAKKGGKA
jgi:hypothetical protein